MGPGTRSSPGPVPKTLVGPTGETVHVVAGRRSPRRRGDHGREKQTRGTCVEEGRDTGVVSGPWDTPTGAPGTVRTQATQTENENPPLRSQSSILNHRTWNCSPCRARFSRPLSLSHPHDLSREGRRGSQRDLRQPRYPFTLRRDTTNSVVSRSPVRHTGGQKSAPVPGSIMCHGPDTPHPLQFGVYGGSPGPLPLTKSSL